jgi:hypothetical protein
LRFAEVFAARTLLLLRNIYLLPIQAMLYVTLFWALKGLHSTGYCAQKELALLEVKFIQFRRFGIFANVTANLRYQIKQRLSPKGIMFFYILLCSYIKSHGSKHNVTISTRAKRPTFHNVLVSKPN